MWSSVIACLVVEFVSVRGQAPIVPPLGAEFDEKGPDGSYKFGFQTGDRGNHYRTEVASKENQVVGRFGARDPAKGRVIETQYTAGRRGFRARGPNIARQMDISQAKIPYNPPVRQDSPNYQPTYSGYHDPNENPSYKFGFRTPVYNKQEQADSAGHVEGVYSFIDDVGERHDVRYEAGSGVGFNVKTAFPDSKLFGGLFYSGPPGKAGGKPRGRSSIQQRLDGSYQFVANAPDHRRAEISDRSGNVRGSYTFLDDKGQQRTIEYIAGPNIGYKVIRKGVGPGFPPGPSFSPPTSFFPPFSPSFDGIDSGDFSVSGGSSGRPKPGGSSLGGSGGGQGGGGGQGIGGGSSGWPYPSGSSNGGQNSGSSSGNPFNEGGDSSKRPIGNVPPGSLGSFGDGGTGFGDSSYPRPSGQGGTGPGSSGGKPGSSIYPVGTGPGNQFTNRPGSDPTGSGGIFDDTVTGTTPSTIGTSPIYGETHFDSNDPFSNPPPDYVPFVTTPTTTYRPPTTSSIPPGYPSSGGDIFGQGRPSGPGSKEPPFQGYPGGRPQNGISLIPGDLPNNCCRSRPSSTSISLSTTSRSPPSNYDDIYLQSPSFSNDSPVPPPPSPFRPTAPPPPDYSSRHYSEFALSYDESRPGSTFRERYNKDDDAYMNSDKNFIRVPGTVRAHIQSLDLPPYGSRIPNPGEALERGFSHSKQR